MTRSNPVTGARGFAPPTLRISALLLVAWLGGSGRSADAQQAPAVDPAQDRRDASLIGRPDLRFEPTGLSILQPYQPGKIPVVFIHGFWGNPWQWARMIEELEGDPALRDRYQFWAYGYATNEPIPYLAHVLRRTLHEARLRLDPQGTDAALDGMVLVGHSMGGLLAKMLVQDGGDRLWDLVTDRPFEQIKGTEADRELLRDSLVFKPLPEIRRLVFIATPHRGTRMDLAQLANLKSRLVRMPDPLQAAHHRMIAANGADAFKKPFRDALPMSYDELREGSPLLVRLNELGLAPGVPYHTIIADPCDDPAADCSDGVVATSSAHLDGAASERRIRTGHFCQAHPEVIREVGRILRP